MKFDGQVTIKAPRHKVWQFLTDPHGVSQCVPGLESMHVITPQEKFQAVAAIGLGTVKVRFNTEVEWLDLEEPGHAKLKAKGTAPGNSMEAIGQMDLLDGPDDTTELKWSAEIKIFGTIANLAARLMGSVTRKLTKAFFDCVKEKIET